MHYRKMLNKQANLMQMQEELLKVAYNELEEYNSAVDTAENVYKETERDINDKYKGIRKGIGALGAGGYALGRGISTLKGKKKFGARGVLGTLGAGGASHLGATALTSSSKNREKEDAYNNIVSPVKLGDY